MPPRPHPSHWQIVYRPISLCTKKKKKIACFRSGFSHVIFPSLYHVGPHACAMPSPALWKGNLISFVWCPSNHLRASASRELRLRAHHTSPSLTATFFSNKAEVARLAGRRVSPDRWPGWAPCPSSSRLFIRPARSTRASAPFCL